MHYWHEENNGKQMHENRFSTFDCALVKRTQEQVKQWQKSCCINGNYNMFRLRRSFFLFNLITYWSVHLCRVVYYQEAQMTPSHTRANIINVGVPNTCAATLLTLLLKASHDLDIGEVLQLVAHRDGVVRGAELTVYGRLRAQGRLHAWRTCWEHSVSSRCISHR